MGQTVGDCTAGNTCSGLSPVSPVTSARDSIKMSLHKLYLPVLVLLLTVSQGEAQGPLSARYCCEEGETLTVRSLGRDRRVADCVVGEDTSPLEGKEVWVGGDQGEYRVLKKIEVKQPTCRRGLHLRRVNINSTDTQDNVTIPLFGSDVISLKGGNRPGEGNVFVNGDPVCDDSWEDVDARVACRMLGYSNGRAISNSRFGRIPGGDYGMDNVECEGYEDRLTDCQFSSSDDCSEDEAAGVICGDGDYDSGDLTSELTLDGSLKLVTFTRNHNNTVLRPQGEFCLAQDASEVSTDRRYSDHEGVYAAYCDSCASQVLCYYSKQLFRDITRRREEFNVEEQDRNEVIPEGFAATADTNGDKIVDFDEFLEQLKEYIRAAFTVMDKNDDNSISEEIQAGEILTRYSLEFFETALVHLMNFFDTNKNNALEHDDVLFGSDRRYTDRNEDGVLTLSELLGTSLISLPAPLYHFYTKLDRNKDEKLNQTEAIDFIKRTFHIMDSNSDCFIDEEDVGNFFKKLGVRPDIQLAIKLTLQKYLTLANFLIEQFEEKADKDQDGRVTVEEIIGFEDFDFVEDSFPMITALGYPNGPVSYLISGGYAGPGGRRERQEERVAVWLRALQELMEQPEYSLPKPSTTCSGTELEGINF